MQTFSFMHEHICHHTHSEPLPAVPSPYESAFATRPDGQQSHVHTHPQWAGLSELTSHEHPYTVLEVDNDCSDGRAAGNQNSDQHYEDSYKCLKYELITYTYLCMVSRFEVVFAEMCHWDMTPHLPSQ